MLRATIAKRTSCSFRGLVRATSKRCYVTDLNTVATENKKKKKLSEQTPEEIEAELRENIIHLKKFIERDESENIAVPIFKKTLLHIDQVAIKDFSGEYTYLRLFLSAKRLAVQISNLCGSASLSNVGYLCSNNILSPLAQWSCWISGQVAMPMNIVSSPEMLGALLEDAKSSLLIVSPEYEKLGRELTQKLDIPLLTIDPSFVVPADASLSSVPHLLIATQDSVIVGGTFTNDFYDSANAMLLYTPGTAGKPKGVMISHRNLNAQVKSLVEAWKFNSNDCFMHALPLNNALGAVNAFLGVMSVGGRIVMQNDSSGHNVWSTLLGINKPAKERVNVFMAVPAVYNALLVEYEKTLAKNNKMVEYISNYFKENVRLMTSYSAPLPPTIFRRWREITGHSVVEAYGSTECGLVMSNQYAEATTAEDKRVPGVVGLPLPDVRVRLVDAKGEVLVDCLGDFENNVIVHKFLSVESLEDIKKNQAEQAKKGEEKDAQAQAAARSEKAAPIDYTVAALAEGFLRNAKKFVAILMQPDGIVQTTLRRVLKKIAEKDNKTAKNERRTAESIFAAPPKKADDKLKSQMTSATEALSQISCAKPPSLVKPPTPVVETQKPAPTDVLLGELEISGPQVFNSYYGSPLLTYHTFYDGFYKTGDIATYQNGVFKVLGRSNVDVIEIAGKKISSYDIESILLEHPSIRDVTVVTITENIKFDEETVYKPAESIGVICVLNEGAQLDLESLNEFCLKSLPQYLFPKKLRIVEELPRSNMAVIKKHDLKQLLSDEKSDTKPEQKSEKKPEEKLEKKPEMKLEEKLEKKPEKKAEEKPDKQSEKQSEKKCEKLNEKQSEQTPKKKSEEAKMNEKVASGSK